MKPDRADPVRLNIDFPPGKVRRTELSASNNAADGGKQAILAQALAYVAMGMRIFPVDARKRPIGALTPHGVKQASDNPKIIRYWWDYAPFADWAWALPADVLVLDIDVKSGRNGFRDFRRIDRRDPYAIETPMASTPSGGLQLFFAVKEPYRGLAPAIKGTGLDTRAEGNYVVLPGPGNGRAWLKPLEGATLAPAPRWLDGLRKSAQPVPKAHVPLATSTPQAKREALTALEKACARIATALDGEQRSTLNRESFYIGRHVGVGALARDVAESALAAAAARMRNFRAEEPWTAKRLAQQIKLALDDGIAKAPGEERDL
jgi:hypothetical protein